MVELGQLIQSRAGAACWVPGHSKKSNVATSVTRTQKVMKERGAKERTEQVENDCGTLLDER
jgi:hypothetical protein